MKTILIVEDDKELCKGYSSFLSDDYTVLCAHDGREAIGTFNSNAIDLVILDLIMPDMNGLETLKELKKLSNDVKIIVLTALGDPAIEHSFLSLGAVSFLRKPVRGKELLSEVQKALK